MPYHLEKGPTLLIVEQYLNAGQPVMRQLLNVLRASEGTLDWIENGLTALWADPAFSQAPSGSGIGARDDIVTKWFGYSDPTGPKDPGLTTGYWIAYDGDVAEIVRRTLCWALELSLGIEPGDNGSGRSNPWPIEVFWKCPTPWFEGWVATRPARGGGWRGPSGTVTIVFMTPSHVGANVSESPIATSATAQPAPGVPSVPSWQDDYEVLGQPVPVTGRPRVRAIDRSYATWVVTHQNHATHPGEVIITSNTTEPSDFTDWGIPQLSIYRGEGDVVVVAPSMAAGGVTYNGTV
jgi:hypothetical protein